MKLHEIIERNEQPDLAILVDEILKYKKSLITIFGKDAILMVTDIFNACQYAKISHPQIFEEDLDNYINSHYSLSDEEKEEEKELINFQSILLKDL